MSHCLTIPSRLDKFVRDSGALSLDETRRAILEGRVTVHPARPGGDDRVANERLVYPGDEVMLDGAPVSPRLQHRYFALNKPKGVTSTARDPDRRRDLSEYLALMSPGVFPVGRLDRDTTGLLLFTSDGDLASAILRPDSHANKLYWLWLDLELDQDDPRLRMLLAGVPTARGLSKAKAAQVVFRTDAYTELHLTLDMGKNRQIRRMCSTLDLRLVHLHRKSVGPIGLSGLPLGQFRELSNQEIGELWDLAGGREYVKNRRIFALFEEAEKARLRGFPLDRLEEWLEENAPSPLPGG